MRILRIVFASAFVVTCFSSAFAHGDKKKPKIPTKAMADLKIARTAMDAYKTELTRTGQYACCMARPAGSTVSGCDLCAATSGGCKCGENLAKGLGVCGECHGGWKSGKGSPAYRSFAAVANKIVPAEVVSGPAPSGDRGANYASYIAAMTRAKRTMVGEKRFNCCVSRGGCDECAHETFCPCAANLLEDSDPANKGKKKIGVCGSCVDGQMSGHSRVGTIDPANLTLTMMDTMEMQGLLGTWSMNREGSGTTWQPEASTMTGKMSESGKWMTMEMGSVTVAGTSIQSGRKATEIFVPSQYMLMARRETGGQITGIRVMGSLDPLLIGGRGYPDLLQTGETWGGKPLKDRQHPHDLIMEVAASSSFPLSGNVRGFLYLAPIGEPAIGFSAYPHRPSGMLNPLSPITHHWFDGTHITYGVLTAGLTVRDKWKLEGSLFTGREPDEDRYGWDKMRFDSASARLTYNPNSNWSFQASTAFLRSPEALNPGNAHRWTASAQYSREVSEGRNLSLLVGYGENRNGGPVLPALILEAALQTPNWSLFGRYESVNKDELVDVPTGNYRIGKISFGGELPITKGRQWNQSVGAVLDVGLIPTALRPSYGSSPIALTGFYRIRM